MVLNFMKALLLVIVSVGVIGAIGGLFLLNSTQQGTNSMMDVSKEQMQKEVPKEMAVDVMAKDVFTLKNVNGGKISLAELQNSGKPVLIYFFATWCPTCERDLKSLNSVYEEYQGKVEIIVIGFDPTETSEQIKQYRQSRGYTWAFAEYSKDALLHYKVITQSTKIGIDVKGNEIFRDGYGVLNADDWTARLDRLLA
ncbi:MAG: TlpA family protein disulfide reductase [Thaumarchaeota archaeon]|nr:TlpA family protein disulfide reductase [Nitrososphaerota archaeon]